jgi:polysaccharide export outer membrane protein
MVFFSGGRPGTLYILVFVLINASCVNTSKAVYFNSIGNASFTTPAGNPQRVIQRNDLLNIPISSPNAEANRIFNSPNSGDNSIPRTYRVNQQGYIEFPYLGEMKAEGLLKSQLKEQLTRAILEKQLPVDRVIDLRYVNVKISVAGGLAHAAILNLPNAKISILKALDVAGELPGYERRDNVLVMPEEAAGTKQLTRLNFSASEIFKTPYYYLKSNDLAYLEPNKLGIAAGGFSLAAIVVAD